MMKKILLLTLFLVLSGCTATGGGGNPWNKNNYGAGNYGTQAVGAPSKLDRDTYAAPPATSTTAQNAATAQTAQHADFSAVIGGADTGTTTGTSPQAMPVAAQSLPPVKVALLLPLSGDHADLGQSMLQAAQLALFDMGYDAFELMPRDTRGTPQGAAQAAESAARDGAQLVLGPLFAAEVRAAKAATARYSLNMIAFSTDWTLAGGNTFIMGFLPFGQVQRIAEYAAARGIGEIGIIAPNTDYGNAVVTSYKSVAYGPRAAIARYTPGNSETAGIVSRFTDYETRSAASEAGQAPPPPFDAVLLPVGGDEARTIANMLSHYDLPPQTVKRLGTGLWDDINLAGEQALAGAWFAAPSPDLRRDFERKYRELYGTKPQRLATLAYDATALAAVMAKKSFYETGRIAFDRQALVNPNGFAGIDGIFRFRPDGMAERGLAVLEFNRGEIKVVDPAPTTFQRLSY